jgi:hypothetical protein
MDPHPPVGQISFSCHMSAIQMFPDLQEGARVTATRLALQVLAGPPGLDVSLALEALPEHAQVELLLEWLLSRLVQVDLAPEIALDDVVAGVIPLKHRRGVEAPMGRGERG